MKKPVRLHISRGHAFALLMAVAYVVLMFLSGIGCPVRYVTGVPCPGCGLTRAALAAFALDFPKAFQYHPLFWLVPITVIVGFSKRVEAWMGVKRRYWILYLSGGLFLAVYIARLVLNRIV